MNGDRRYERMTPHFHRKEFRCRGNDNNLCNCGGSAAVSKTLVNGLESFRTLLNDKRLDNAPEIALRINSGFRCYAYNKVPTTKNGPGSDDKSQHPRGTAADVDKVQGFSTAQMAELAEEIPEFAAGGIGVYANFVHLDVRENGPARWNG